MVRFEGQWREPAQVLEIERVRAEARAAEHRRDAAAAEVELKRTELAQKQLELAAAREHAAAENAPATMPPASAAQPMYVTPAYTRWSYGEPSCDGPHRRCKLRSGAPTLPPFPIAGAHNPWDTSVMPPGVRDPRSRL